METKPCAICGEPLTKRKTDSRRVWEKRLYCSRACYGKATSIRQRQLPDRECQNCGKTFRPTDFGKKYCSLTCAHGNIAYRRGADHPSWKGGKVEHVNGYYMLRRDGKYVMEHRAVMEEHLGRPLARTETIHHINGDKLDNRIENLQLRSGRHGNGTVRACADCGSRHIIDVPL